MFKNIKLLKQLKNESLEIEFEENAEFTNERNEALIYVNINSANDVISKFSAGEDLTINNDLSDYLNEKADSLDISYPINIKFTNSKELTKNDKDKIKLACRNHFTQKISSVNEEFNRNKVECIMLSIFTILSLIGYIACKLIPLTFVSEIIGEIVLIISWVFAWRLIESIAFERRKMRKEAVKFYRLLNARIDFFN